jgi:ribosomal protein L9
VLVPKEIAVIYDQQTKNQQSTQMTRIAKLKEAEQAKVKEMLATIEADGGLTFSKQATEDDSLYDSITNRSLLAYASKTFGVTLQPKNFEIDKIESLGEYVAKFTYQDIAQDIAIHVTRATTTEIEETA